LILKNSGFVTNQIFGRLCQPDGLVSGEGLGQADGQEVLQREEVVVVEHDRRDVHLKSFIYFKLIAIIIFSVFYKTIKYDVFKDKKSCQS
jgi:hypothetical protein